MGCQRRQQGGQDGPQQLPRELITGQPRPLEQRRQVSGHVLTRPPGGPAPRARAGSQPPDRRLAMTTGRATVLVEQPAALALVDLLIPRPHHRGILPTPSLGHGVPFPVCRVVTPVLRQPLSFREQFF